MSLPLKLAAGLAWTLYAVLTLTIHPFTLHGLAPKLESVSFTHGSNGDEHAKALAAAFSSGRMPGSLGNLSLACTDMGDQGATALAAALLESGVGCQLMLNSCV